MASASYPDVSLSLFLSRDENLRAREGGKEKTGETCIASLLYGFPWFLALSHQSLTFCARLNTKPCENEAPEEEAGIAWFARNDPLYQYSSGTLIKRVKKSASLHRDGFSIRLSLGLELFASLLLFASHKRLIHKPISRWCNKKIHLSKARLPGSCISPRMAVQLRSS